MAAAAPAAAAPLPPVHQQAPAWAQGHVPEAVHPPQLALGLTNEAGEYNCFLNVIIQCLWHCSEFRQQVRTWAA